MDLTPVLKLERIQMLWSLFLLVVGLLLIIKGGDLFVSAAVRVAEFLHMPRVVIGSTLVSLATTTPELVVSIMAGLERESDLAIGNAVGSCICNIALILGVTAAIKQVDVHRTALRQPLTVMLVFGAALFLMTLDLSLARWQGAVLLTAGIAYFVWEFYSHWRIRKPAVVAEAVAIEKDIAEAKWPWFETKQGTCVQFLSGAGLVVLGSKLLVEGAAGAASRFGIPTIVVGLTIVAVGTSLPELITAITSSRKAVSDLAVGNVLGANIANLSLIVGTAAIIQEVKMDRVNQMLNLPVMLAIMLLLVWMLRTDRRLSRREGGALLGIYACYIAAVIVCAVLNRG
jgi:cation:H+ antiporter